MDMHLVIYNGYQMGIKKCFKLQVIRRLDVFLSAESTCARNEVTIGLELAIEHWLNGIDGRIDGRKDG